MEPINIIIVCVVVGMAYVSMMYRINGLNKKLDLIMRKANKANENLDKVLKLQSAIGEDLSDIGSAVYGIYNNVELMSSMNMAAYVANTNETIRQLIKHDKFEAAQMLKNNLEKLVNDFKKINPKCNLEIRDANELTRGIFGEDDED